MSKLIRQLLDEKDPLFSVGVARLEKSAGNPAIDVRLTAEIMTSTRGKMSSIGLDPKDTTGAELYSALTVKAQESESYVLAYLGHPANIDQSLGAISQLAKEISGEMTIWRVKHAVLKKICKTNPPKKVMKAFHFQSVDSLNKRMDIGEVFCACRILESKTWWEKTKKIFNSLKEQDFEMAVPQIIPAIDEKWQPILELWEKSKGHRVLISKEAGTICFSQGIGSTRHLVAVVALLRTINELRIYSSYLKLHYVHPTIGNVLVHAVDDGNLIHASVSGAVFHWRDVHRYFGILSPYDDVSFVHLDVHDLGWLHAETSLSLRIPELAFWVGTDFLGVSYGEGKVISMNLLDVAISNEHKLTPKTMSTVHLARSLRSELMARYVQFPASRALVLKQFDISGMTEENW